MERGEPNEAHHVAGRQADPASLLRDERQRQPGFFDLAPERLRPDTLVGGCENVSRDMLREQLASLIEDDPRRVVRHHEPVHQRKPNPRAIIPRMISRVPPRIV